MKDPGAVSTLPDPTYRDQRRGILHYGLNNSIAIRGGWWACGGTKGCWMFGRATLRCRNPFIHLGRICRTGPYWDPWTHDPINDVERRSTEIRDGQLWYRDTPRPRGPRFKVRGNGNALRRLAFMHRHTRAHLIHTRGRGVTITPVTTPP